MARILLVENETGGRQVMGFNLRRAGHTVDEAENGNEGLALFCADRHDLVITDVRMPGLSGIELARRIHELAAQVPVVVITAYGSTEVTRSAARVGAQGFLTKPFDRDQLLEAVDRVLAI